MEMDEGGKGGAYNKLPFRIHATSPPLFNTKDENSTLDYQEKQTSNRMHEGERNFTK